MSRSREAAKRLLVHYIADVGGNSELPIERGEVESIVDLIVDAAVEEAVEAITKKGGVR